MLIILFFLILGVIVGYFNLLSSRVENITNYLTLGGLFLLLFTMGVKIGVDQEVISNLESLGYEAMVLAITSILGSVVFLFFFELKSFLKEKNKGEESC